MAQQRQASSNSNSTTSDNKTHVILGVTGSVAAVKAPEIALRLVVEQGLAVKIVLTQGGRHFWEQSRNYNGEIWNKFEACLEQESKKEDPWLTVIGECELRCHSRRCALRVDDKTQDFTKRDVYAPRPYFVVSHSDS